MSRSSVPSDRESHVCLARPIPLWPAINWRRLLPGLLFLFNAALLNNVHASNATQERNVPADRAGDSTTTAVTTTPITAANVGQPITITALVTDIASGHSANIPSGTVNFSDRMGSTEVPLNRGAGARLSAGTATLGGVWLNGAGVHTVTASYSGIGGSFSASTATVILAVSKSPVMIGTLADQPIRTTSLQASSVSVKVNGPYVGFAVPTGTITYQLLGPAETSVVAGSLSLTAANGYALAQIRLQSGLASGLYTLSIRYSGDSNYQVSAAPVTMPVSIEDVSSRNRWGHYARPVHPGQSYSQTAGAVPSNQFASRRHSHGQRNGAHYERSSYVQGI